LKDLSPQAKAYILSVIGIGIVLLALNLIHLDLADWINLLVLSILASLSLVYRVLGSTSRSYYSINFLVYAFTFVIYGTEACILVIFCSILVEWVWYKLPWYIECFNISAYVIVIYLAGVIYKWANPSLELFTWVGVGSILIAMGVFTLLNHLLVGVVIWMARGENFSKSGIFDFFPVMLDFNLLCMGAGAALIWNSSPFAVILILLPLYLIYTTLRVPALERQSELDSKTGLFNAKFFDRTLLNELSRANRFDRPLTIVMADLDLLRNINNTYGHLAGDQVLIGVANILKKSVREYDLVSRFGGEEYAVLMPETTPTEAFPHIEAIREEIERAEFIVPTSVTPIKITMSFGIAGREGFDQTPGDIVHNADAALYHAKLKGRNGTFIFVNESFTNLKFTPAEQKSQSSDALTASHFDFQDTSYNLGTLKSSFASDIGISEQKEDKGKVYPKWLVNGYIALTALAAIFLFVMFFKPVWDLDWLGLALFAIMVIMTEGLSIDIYVRDTAVSTSAAPMLAGVLLYGHTGALVLSLTFALVAMIKHRSRFNRFIFNASNQLIAGLIYSELILLSGFTFNQLPPLFQFFLCLASVGIVFLCTTVLISIGMGLDHEQSIREIWIERFSWLVLYYFAMGLIAYTLIFGYQTRGLLGTIVVMVPLLLLRLSQIQYVERTKTMVSEVKVKNTALEKSAEEINKLNEGLLNTLAMVVDLRDPYVLGHSKQVSRYAALMAERLGLPPRQVELVRKAGLLHDIGKLGISESILFKAGTLTPFEYEQVKDHVTLGADILNTSSSLRQLVPIIRHHHEWYNGYGYPEGLKSIEIPLEARILAVADAIEAMASDRPYRRSMNYQEIIDELRKSAGTQFDSMVVNAFIEVANLGGQRLIVNIARKSEVEDSSQTDSRSQQSVDLP